MSRRAPGWVLGAAVLLAAPACNGDDDTAPVTSSPSVTEPSPTTLPSTTEQAAVTTSSLSPTTSADLTTTSVADPTAAIAEDLRASLLANYAALVDPSLDTLPNHLQATVVPGSPIETSLRDYVTYLVGLGDGIVPNEPDILEVSVEAVDLLDGPPYSRALVTVCEVENRRQVTLSRNTSDGREIEVEGSGDLQAVRSTYDARLTAVGWRLWETIPAEGAVYVGSDGCPPA